MQRTGREQRAIIEMLCDKDKTGSEGEVDPTGEFINLPAETKDNAESASQQLRRADGGEGHQDGGDEPPEHQLMKKPKNDTALIFDSYGPLADNGNIDVLRLTWYTKLACEGEDQNEGGGDSGGSGKSEHWGFFTWMIML